MFDLEKGNSLLWMRKEGLPPFDYECLSLSWRYNFQNFSNTATRLFRRITHRHAHLLWGPNWIVGYQRIVRLTMREVGRWCNLGGQIPAYCSSHHARGHRLSRRRSRDCDVWLQLQVIRLFPEVCSRDRTLLHQPFEVIGVSQDDHVVA